jgi:hypothetical protein
MISDPGLPERKAERPETAMVWRDLGEVEAEEAVLRGESLLLLGIAGTGKAHRAQGIVERLRCAGKRVDVISKTHTASRRAGGATADHWVRRHILHGSASCDVLWIDEVSQVDVGLMNQIAKLHWAGVKFLLPEISTSSPRSAIIAEAPTYPRTPWSEARYCIRWPTEIAAP